MGKQRKELRGRERAFVKHYVAGVPGVQGFSRASAVAAGLGPGDVGAGSKMLARPHVRAAIEAFYAKQNVTIDRVVAELARVGFSDMREFAEWGPDGVRLKSSEELPDDAAVVVSEVSETSGEKSQTIRFKLHDKIEALALLGKSLRLFGEGSTNVFTGPTLISWQSPPDVLPSPTPPALSSGNSTTPSSGNSRVRPSSSATDDLENL